MAFNSGIGADVLRGEISGLSLPPKPSLGGETGGADFSGCRYEMPVPGNPRLSVAPFRPPSVTLAPGTPIVVEMPDPLKFKRTPGKMDIRFMKRSDILPPSYWQR